MTCPFCGRPDDDRCGCSPEAPGPTDEDVCGAGGHAYYGDDGDRGRCYCGAQQYPPGGQASR